MYEIPKENSFSPQNGYAQLHFYQRYPSRRAMDTQIGEQNQNQDQILFKKKLSDLNSNCSGNNPRKISIGKIQYI